MHMTNNTSGVISFVACIAYRVSVKDPPGKGRSVSEIYYVLDISGYSFEFIRRRFNSPATLGFSLAHSMLLLRCPLKWSGWLVQ